MVVEPDVVWGFLSFLPLYPPCPSKDEKRVPREWCVRCGGMVPGVEGGQNLDLHCCFNANSVFRISYPKTKKNKKKKGKKKTKNKQGHHIVRRHLVVSAAYNDACSGDNCTSCSSY